MSIISVSICAMENLLCLRFLFLTIYTICALIVITAQRSLVVQPLLFVTHGVESIAKFGLFIFKMLLFV